MPNSFEGICGFGEFATRLQSNGAMNDAASISDPRRLKIYDAAEARGTPVNMHVSLAEAETVAAYETIVAARPHVPFILNHGGLTAGPDLNATRPRPPSAPSPLLPRARESAATRERLPRERQP